MIKYGEVSSSTANKQPASQQQVRGFTVWKLKKISPHSYTQGKTSQSVEVASYAEVKYNNMLYLLLLLLGSQRHYIGCARRYVK
jgi:hypothetical protein